MSQKKKRKAYQNKLLHSLKEKNTVGFHETQTRCALTSIVWIVLTFPNPLHIITTHNILNAKLISCTHSSLRVPLSLSTQQLMRA